MKEIGPIPRKLWPFESTHGHSSHYCQRLDILQRIPSNRKDQNPTRKGFCERFIYVRGCQTFMNQIKMQQ